MKRFNYTALLLLLAITIVFTACNRNYYSGNGKANKNCGCPGQKGGSGW
jgi:predicted small secreted protein